MNREQASWIKTWLKPTFRVTNTDFARLVTILVEEGVLDPYFTDEIAENLEDERLDDTYRYGSS